MPLLSSTAAADAAVVLHEIIEQGNFIFVGKQVFLLSPLSPAGIDALAAFSADGEDLEDEPVEADADEVTA